MSRAARTRVTINTGGGVIPAGTEVRVRVPKGDAYHPDARIVTVPFRLEGLLVYERELEYEEERCKTS